MDYHRGGFPSRIAFESNHVIRDFSKELRFAFRENQSMQQLADTFATFLGRPVLDRTGLKGEFDFTMEYEADPDAANLPGGAVAGPALFTALQEQAGLKLESTKGAVEVLVIDHAEKPSGN